MDGSFDAAAACGISSESEAVFFVFFLLELTDESEKSKAKFSQNSKESKLTWTDVEFQFFAFYFEETNVIENQNSSTRTRALLLLGCNPDAADFSSFPPILYIVHKDQLLEERGAKPKQQDMPMRLYEEIL